MTGTIFSDSTVTGYLAYSNEVWRNWTITSGTSITIPTSECITSDVSTSTPAWTDWVTKYYSFIRQQVSCNIVRETKEEQQARVQRELQAEKERIRRRKQKAEANHRAEKFLESLLNQAQREVLKKENYVYVRSQNGRLYRLDRGKTGNIHELDPETGKIIDRMCVHVADPEIPEADNLSTQILALTGGCEDQLLEKANHWGLNYARPSKEEIQQILAVC